MPNSEREAINTLAGLGRRVNRSDLKLLTHGPLTRMGVVSDTGRMLWVNDSMAEVLPDDPEAERTLVRMLGPAMAAERAGLHPRIIETAAEDAFYEMLGGVRHLTRLLPIDEADFSSRGVLVIALPSVLPRTARRGRDIMTLATGSWGRLERLSNRELEVLRLMALRACTKAVAGVLGRSVKTIENQIQAIHDKLGISMRGELVRIAVEAGLHAFEDDEWMPLLAGRAAT